MDRLDHSSSRSRPTPEAICAKASYSIRIRRRRPVWDVLRVVESGDPRRLTRSQHTDEPAAGSGCRSLRKTLRLVSAVAKHAPELLELGLEQREARTGRQPSSRLPPSATARRASRRWMAARAPNSGQWRAPGAVRRLSSTSEPAGRSRQATSTAVPARRATQATPCRAGGDNPTTTLRGLHIDRK